MAKHREVMESHVAELLESHRSSMITGEKYDEIVGYLKDRTQAVSAHFRHWVKSRHFALMDFPALGVTDALIIPAKVGSNPGKFLRVISTRNMFDVTKTVHESEMDQCHLSSTST